MAPPLLRGDRVVLRAPRPEDVDDRLAAGRDAEFRRMVGVTPAARPLTRADAEHWHAELAREPYGWVVEHGGRCVGVARLHHVDLAAGEGWLALGVFAPEHRGRGLGTEAVLLMLGHAFGALALGAVRLRVLAFNAQAIACYRRCGFRETGREPAMLDGGAAEDILMEVTPAEFGASGPTAAGRAP